jgi:hypothetical protein
MEGIWQIDEAIARPTGITIDPEDDNHIWIVDSGSDSVYQYDGATIRISGHQAADDSFALDPANRNPQGIAAPRPASQATMKSTGMDLPDALEKIVKESSQQLASPFAESDNSRIRSRDTEFKSDFPNLDSSDSIGMKFSTGPLSGEPACRSDCPKTVPPRTPPPAKATEKTCPQ